MKGNHVSALDKAAMVHSKNIFHVTNIPLVIFIPSAFIAFIEKVINLLLAPMALILGLDANLVLTHIYNSTVLSKLKMRQKRFLPSFFPPVQSCAAGIKSSLLNLGSKVSPYSKINLYLAPAVTDVPFLTFINFN